MKYLLFVLLICAVVTRPAAAQERPNIVFIYADDLGYGELGCYGQQKIRTPNIDRLARAGMRFTQFYSGTPVCAPARCQWLTGQHSGHSYIRGNYEFGGFADSTEGGQMPLYPGIPTVAALLKGAGYATACIGKWGLGMPYNTGDPQRHGFDHFFGYYDQKQAHNYYPTHLWENGRRVPLDNPPINVHTRIADTSRAPGLFAPFLGRDYSIDRMTAQAKKFIRQHRHRPFFLYLPFTLPHLALQVPPEALKPYETAFDETPYCGQKGYNPCLKPRATYAAMISYLDRQVGELCRLLQQLGLERNTLVVFSSDNGPSFTGGVDYVFFNSQGGLRGLKMDLYEGGIRVPFIARWPGKIPAGRTSPLVACQYDLLATFCELTTRPAPASDGISFLPTLLGKTQRRHHEWLYFEYPENGGWQALRIGNWKGVRRNIRKDPQAPWELYDLSADRQEALDVASGHPDVVRRMEQIAKREHRQPHIREWEFLLPHVRSLGGKE